MFQSPFPGFIGFCCKNISSLALSISPYPEEQDYIASVTSLKRKREFLLGRDCAHEAISILNFEQQPILKNPKTREPMWPDALTGTITHSKDWAVAAVGTKKKLHGIGIDIEDLQRHIHSNIRSRVCLEKEIEWLNSLTTLEADRFLKIIFSAKESIFKCFFPFSRNYLYFHDALIEFNDMSGEFIFTLLKSCGDDFPAGFQHSGKYAIVNGMVLTSIYLEKP